MKSQHGMPMVGSWLSVSGEEESRSDQNPPSHPHRRVMGQKAAGSRGGFLPFLRWPC